jgi:hypothetical protein
VDTLVHIAVALALQTETQVVQEAVEPIMAHLVGLLMVKELVMLVEQVGLVLVLIEEAEAEAALVVLVYQVAMELLEAADYKTLF